MVSSPGAADTPGTLTLLLLARDGIEAIVLAGTDLNLVFNETNAGFPAVDCAAAYIEAIVAQMARQA